MVDGGVDWPCRVLRNYADTNLGCARRVSSGIAWAFEHVDEAVVLEDDCVPAPSFFTFCGGMLERFRHDTRIMCVSGDNFQPGPRGPFSYYFSKYPHCWGWATWRRAWNHFDFDMTGWPEFRDRGGLASVCPDPAERTYWAERFASVAAGRMDSWAYRWTYACWSQSGMTVLPEVNLVSNIGFGPDATHTVTAASIEGRPTGVLGEIRHPRFVIEDRAADEYTFRTHFCPTRPVEPLWRKALRLPSCIWRRFTASKAMDTQPVR